MLVAASIGQVALVSAEDAPVTSLRLATLIAHKKSITRSGVICQPCMLMSTNIITIGMLINRPSDLYSNSDE